MEGRTAALVRRLPDGWLVMVDGYSRLTALADLPNVVITFDIWIKDVENEREAADEWRSFSNTRLRTKAEFFKSIGVAEEHGLVRKTAESLFDNIPLIAAEFRPPVRFAPHLQRSFSGARSLRRETRVVAAVAALPGGCRAG
jgi:hypothetical protein